ncbi:MAG: RNA 2',3'-cyclic phosphodiesterase [Verrucomicrobia bacterium]|nr:MAG: RNA 2',3'-cyclic phosphodiesterase [Verrucomicrobiota bacterium]
MKPKRLFVAIDFPQSVRAFLFDLDPQIRGVRWIAAEQMHLTLGFFGDVPEDVDAKFREKLSAIHFGAFFLPLAGVGTFPPKGPPKIIWIGTGRGHPHLFQLHKRVTDADLAVGLEPDLRLFHPHITLAQSMRKFLQTNVDLDAGMVHVESFHLYSSELTPAGPIHTPQLTVSWN